MNNSLQPLKTSSLTNMEFGQLMKRHLIDLSSIDQMLLNDQPYNAYLQQLNEKLEIYEKGLARVLENEETELISLADKGRDRAVVAFSKVLKLFAVSENADEVEASRKLGILFHTFKNLPYMNYEAESIGIDKLVSHLESANYSDLIKLLDIGRFVTRMKGSNQNFKALFEGRILSDSKSEYYNMKAVRTALMHIYKDFTDYILAMCKALNTPLFITSLSLINTARKYYADMLAHRSTETVAPVLPNV